VAFPRKLLHDDEEIALDLRPHWWFLAGPSAVLGVSVAALVAMSTAGAPDGVQLALGVAVLAALAWFVARYARWATTHFVVTTDRLVYRSGVFAKRGIEIPLERVNTVFFSQRVYERLLRFGDLVIESAGERGRQAFTDIANPSLVQNEIYHQIEDNQNRMMGGRREPTLAEQLEALDGLRQRGILTQAEFDAKKAQLLGRP
jgi:uncharacterized membrane protein YdbT with pleckstrin-like domain